MKNYLILAVLALGLSFGACQSKAKKTAKAEEASTECASGCNGCASKCSDTKVAESTKGAGIYYFHGDRKCKTCKSVGAQAKEVAAELNVKFYDINIDQEENKDLAKQFEATGSSLMILHAKSGKIEDLTNFAFRNAISNPKDYIEKLKSTLKSES
ncbi:nitrophenyl compound nitroreductase subunit ArsF family protein [Ancylomarina sp. DW003]|nr:nitrophenyl compound nitroreductase subunit ArsF family protein [Ancylomarina sp. DW003]MDE5423800.1 nitrophenyl compound nitroreductase subunit ArsF family protein [Ancylomarina sp. DW003]